MGTGAVGDITNGDGQQEPKVDGTLACAFSGEAMEKLPVQVRDAGIRKSRVESTPVAE